MAYDPELQQRLDELLLGTPDITTKKMFGGLAYLFKKKMTVGILGNELTVRVVTEKMEEVLARPDTRPMDFTGKPMREMAFVAPSGCSTREQLLFWIELGIEHANSKLEA